MTPQEQLEQRVSKVTYDLQSWYKNHPESVEKPWTSEERGVYEKMDKEVQESIKALQEHKESQAAIAEREARLKAYNEYAFTPEGKPVLYDESKHGSGWQTEEFRKIQKAAFMENLRDGNRNPKGIAERYIAEHNLKGIEPYAEWDERTMERSREKRALIVGDSSLGGSMVPVVTFNEIVSNAAALHGVINQVRTVPVTGPYLLMARIKPSGNSRYASSLTSTWRGEANVTAFTSNTFQSNPKTGDIKIVVHKYQPDPIYISSELRADAPAFESEVDRLLTEMYGLDKDDMIFNGNGQDQPVGLLTGAGDLAITTQNSGSSAEFVYTTWLDFIYGVPGQYAASPNFGIAMRRATYGKVLQMKDDAGRFVIQPNEPPMQFQKYPIITSEFVPAVGAGTIAAVAGDFSRYVIADRQEVQIGKLDQVAWPNLNIQLVARYGGQVTVADAFRTYTLT